jgi:ATP-dependent DNA helicase RecG
VGDQLGDVWVHGGQAGVQRGQARAALARQARRLRRAGLIEGRKPHLRVASVIVDATAPEPVVKARSGDDERLLQLIVDHLRVSGSATRKDIDVLLAADLADLADDGQRMRRVTNLLTKLRRDGLIANQGTKASPAWMVTGLRQP